MSTQRIIGIVMLAVGVILLVIGMNSSHSFADQLSNTFTGRFTENTQWYIVGGIVVAITGASLLFIGGRGKSA